MSDEFEKWPGIFQKPGEEEEDHTLHIEQYMSMSMNPACFSRKEDKRKLSGNVEKFWSRSKR